MTETVITSPLSAIDPAASPQESRRRDGLYARPGASEGAVSTILEQRDIKVTFNKKHELIDNLIKEVNSESDFYKGISLRCNCWLCEDCRLSKGIKLREKILAKASMFKAPRLYTITVNRDWFDSPQAAYDYIMKKKFIARLLTKEMGIRRWFWVLEPQEANGDGWPHWHLLIDVGDLPGAWYHKESKTVSEEKPDKLSGWCYIPYFFDLNKVHRLLEKWKIGKQCKLSVKKDSFNNPEHAIRYITKYLIKMPRRGFPPWMLNYPRIRFYQPSNDIGSLGGSLPVKKKKIAVPRPKRPARRPVARVSECAKQVIFISYDQQSDKYIAMPPVWGLRDSIQHCRGAVKREDFDFKSLRSFDVWGFEESKYLLDFFRLWDEPDLKEKLHSSIREKKKRLLEQWDKTAKIAA